MNDHMDNIYPEVERELLGTVSSVSPDPAAIDAKVSELEGRLGKAVWSQLLYLLCHLDFPPNEARAHWTSIFEHRRKLSEKLGQSVDFRVALLDYFISVNQHIRNPKIIEIKMSKCQTLIRWCSVLAFKYLDGYGGLIRFRQLKKLGLNGRDRCILGQYFTAQFIVVII